MASKWTFQAVPGVFADLEEISVQYPNRKVPTQPRLALIPREYPTDSQHPEDSHDWLRFAAYVRSLNRDAPENVSYKVLYLTRHGFGYHNQKSAEVGTELWDSYWSLLDGDDKTTWFDAFLNDVGIQQARDLALFWTNLVDKDGAPLPEKLYTSSLARCLETSRLAFSDLMESHGQPFQPIVKDKLRERYTVHTCDLRRPRSWIAENYPDYIIEEGMIEEDHFRSLGRLETDEEHYARKQAVLGDIYSTDRSEFISLTVHSMAIKAIQAVCDTPQVDIREGSSIALLVRGEKQATSS